MTAVKFVKVARDCPSNNDPRPGHRTIYDYNVMIDGEHRATFRRWRSTYNLVDLAMNGIGFYDYERQSGAVVLAQSEFAALINRALAENQIPTVAEIEQQRIEREAKIDAMVEAYGDAAYNRVVQSYANDLLTSILYDDETKRLALANRVNMEAATALNEAMTEPDIRKRAGWAIAKREDRIR
jgi:hypothetical protein